MEKSKEGTKRGEKREDLWSPYQVGKLRLCHRVVMAAMSRCRALNGIPNDAMVKYYCQRATQGGLLISEGTFISPTALG